MKIQKIERLGMIDRVARDLDDGVDRVKVTASGNAGRFIAVELNFVMDAADDDSQLVQDIVRSLPEALREAAAAIEARNSKP